MLGCLSFTVQNDEFETKRLVSHSPAEDGEFGSALNVTGFCDITTSLEPIKFQYATFKHPTDVNT